MDLRASPRVGSRTISSHLRPSRSISVHRGASDRFRTFFRVAHGRPKVCRMVPGFRKCALCVYEACVVSTGLHYWCVRGGHCSNQHTSEQLVDRFRLLSLPQTLENNMFDDGKAFEDHLIASHCISLHLGAFRWFELGSNA